MTSTPDFGRKLNGADNPKPTSSEEDPCIENEEKNKDMSFRDRTEKKLREKSGLSRRGLYIAGGVLVLLFLLLITVIALAAAWPHTPHHKLFPVCQDAGCLTAAAQIRNALNPEIEPCNDVWSWACGGWLDKNPLPPERSVWNTKEELKVQEAARIRDLINTLPLPLPMNSMEWKLKHLYDSCMEVEIIDADGVRPLLQIITPLGGWHILREWSMISWDYRRVLEKLHAEHGATPFFKISVEPDPRSPKNNSIRISPAGLGLPDRSFYYADQNNKIVLAYKRLLKDIVTLLQATSNNALTFSNDIFFYEKRIAEITPNTLTLQDPIATYNSITVSELRITAASLPLREILVSMFPNAGITDESEVIVSSPDYLMSVSRIISNSDRSALNDYLIWTLVRQYLPYLPSQYMLEYNHYLSELKGVQKPLDRWEYCVDVVQKFMNLAVQAMLEIQNPTSDDTVEDMFKNLKTSALKNINEFKFPAEFHRQVTKKVAALSLNIGLPANVSSKQFLQEYYKKLYIQKSAFFNNIGHGITFLREEQQERYLRPKFEDRIISFVNQEYAEVKYEPAANLIIVPRYLLKNPYYNEKYPLPIKYGRLGIDISKAIINSILPWESSWTKDHGLLTPYHIAVNQSQNQINILRACLEQTIINRGYAPKNVADLVSLSTVKHLSSVKLAYTALTTVLETAPHIHQPTLEEYEDPVLYFMTYSQGQCSLYSTEQLYLVNNLQFSLDDQTLLKLTWKKLYEFPDSMNCRYDKDIATCNHIL